MMRLIEFFDKEPVSNVLMTLALKPDEVYFFMEEKLNQRKLWEGVTGVLRKHIPDLKIFMVRMNLDDEAVLREKLERLVDEHTYVELSGGRDIALIHAGHAALLHGWNVLYVDRINFQVLRLCGCEALTFPIALPKLSVADVIEMTGASIDGNLHQSPDLSDPQIREVLRAGFRIMSRDYSKWTRFMNYLLKGMSVYPMRDDYSYDMAVSIKSGMSGTGLSCDFDILRDLRRAGIIAYEKTPKGVRVQFGSAKIKQLFSSTGGWLEYYTLYEVDACRRFQDYSMSVKIDWDGSLLDFRSATCEIDLLLVSGIVPVFVSCKTGQCNKDALYEIRLMADRFGGKLARAALVTGYDMENRNPDLYKKAQELNICVIYASPSVEGRLGVMLGDLCEHPMIARHRLFLS